MDGVGWAQWVEKEVKSYNCVSSRTHLPYAVHKPELLHKPFFHPAKVVAVVVELRERVKGNSRSLCC